MRLVLLVAAALGLSAPVGGDPPFRDRGPVERVPPSLWREGDPAFGAAGPAHPAAGEPLTPADWRFWWTWNRDAILDARLPRIEHAYCTPRPTADLSTYEQGEWGPEAPWHGDWDRFVRPVLLGIARRRDEPDAVRVQALLALGRARESVSLLLEMASEHAAEPGLRATALLALGLTGHPRDAGSCPHVIASDEGEPSAIRARALSSVALLPAGSIAASLGPGVLESAFARGDRELAVAALVALRAHPSMEALPTLLDIAESGAAGGRPVEDLVRAHALHAACRVPLRHRHEDGGLAARRSRVLHVLLRGAGRLTGFAAVRGLGECVARNDDPDRGAAVAALVLVATGGPGADEDQRRGLALLALARSRIPDRDPDDRVREVLSAALAEGGPAAGWAAIAIGAARDRLAPSSDPAVAEWTRELRRRLVTTSATDGERAAAAIALGLLGDGGAVPALRRLVANRLVAEEVRRGAAEALGLVPGGAARDGIRAALRDPGCAPLRTELCLAAGVAMDASMAGTLADILEDPRSGAAERGAAARALGWIGSTGVRDRLLSLARDPLGARTPAVRAAAVAALGGYAGRGSKGERAPRRDAIGRLAADFPYRAWTPGMGDVLDAF